MSKLSVEEIIQYMNGALTREQISGNNPEQKWGNLRVDMVNNTIDAMKNGLPISSVFSDDTKSAKSAVAVDENATPITLEECVAAQRKFHKKLVGLKSVSEVNKACTEMAELYRRVPEKERGLTYYNSIQLVSTEALKQIFEISLMAKTEDPQT